ncbi:HAD hydrolase family protein [Halomonas sp. LS-001]
MMARHASLPGQLESGQRPVLFTDLDDTLFQTARKMVEPVCESRLAAEATNGHHSYMTASQAAMTTWLLKATCLVPVTARSTEALSRCRIPFDSWKIASNGAVILDPDGKAELDWSQHISRLSGDFEAGLEALNTETYKLNPAGRFRHWIVREQGCPIYFCVKSNGEETWLDDLEGRLRALAGEDFVYHRNGNNLSFTPQGISKRAAVTYLIDIRPEIRHGIILAMGDSLTDLPFMRLANMMMMPPASQVASAIGKE